jgi:hypothetical protein
VTGERTILIQLDTDLAASAFDRIVALDAGADEVLAYAGVLPGQVQGLVHGAIFTRGPKRLHKTALFIGGSNVALAEQLLQTAKGCLLPQFKLTVSILFDPNGANTTAAAAVATAGKHLDLTQTKALVLGTGPVGTRVARLLAHRGTDVKLAGKTLADAEEACRAIRGGYAAARLEPVETLSEAGLRSALAGRQLVIAAGPPGTTVLPGVIRATASTASVLIDLSAVPPAGIEGIAPMARPAEGDKVFSYGALVVGDLKMKLHKDAIARVFERNDLILDAEEIERLARSS